MRAAVPVLLLLGLLAAPGCKARRGEPARDQPATGTAAASPAARSPGGRPVSDACPECGGTGRCPLCGDDRPCLLCDGDGRCALCGGDGQTPDGPCDACLGTGVCPECGGDGVVSRRKGEIGAAGNGMPGECPLCDFGTGLCPDCGGTGRLPDGTVCALCGGEKRCPRCRGLGTDPWCGGTGLCSSCRGHGQVVAGRPGAGWPPVTLVLRTGETIVGRLLGRPGETIDVEREGEEPGRREAVVSSTVKPLGYVLAWRRYLDPDRPEDHVALAEYALRQGADFLFLAASEARRVPAGGAPARRAAAVLERAREETRKAIRDAASRALDAGKDPRRAWALFSLALSLSPAGRNEVATKGRDAALAALAAEGEGLTEPLRARRAQAEADRFARAVRRARDGRTRAEGLLSRTDASVLELLRARHAATRAATEALRAADRAPPGADRAPAVSEGAAARGVETRATVAIAARLLDAGLVERARAVASLALARAPGDQGVLRFLAAVEERLARGATEDGGRK